MAGDPAPRWPPWQTYAPSAANAPRLAFVSAGASRRAFVDSVAVELSSVRGLSPRLLRRRALDVTVACDGEELPKRRGSPGPPTADGAPQVFFSDARFAFFLTRSSAPCVVLFKRAVPQAHRRTLAVVRRGGNAATLLLTLTAPLRAAVRRVVKPRTIAVAVVPLGALRHVGEQTFRLPVLAVPRDVQLEPTARILACLQRQHDAACSAWHSVGVVDVSAKRSRVAGVDDGSYEGPEVLQVQRTAVASQLRAPLANHWVCAHRNMYCSLAPEERGTLAPDALALRAPRLVSWFGYGLLGLTGGASSAVHVFGQRRDSKPEADPFLYGGRFVTDGAGRLELEAPEDMQAAVGHYAIRAVMERDGSVGEGSLFVLEKGTPCVLMDLDGTLNVGDESMTEQMTLDAVWAAHLFDARPQKGVLSVCRCWAARGYQLAYLSGRQGGFYNHTRNWLIRHGFPPGPIALTEHIHLAALPGKARREAAATRKPRGRPKRTAGQGAGPGAGGSVQAPVHERHPCARTQARRRVRQHHHGCAFSQPPVAC